MGQPAVIAWPARLFCLFLMKISVFFLSLFLFAGSFLTLSAQRSLPFFQVVYTAKDSAEVVRLLRSDIPKGQSDVLFFARCFIGRPYVAHTLEVADPERLVVNLRQLDCTTLVETVLALAMTKRQHSDKFSDYCRALESLRYRKGRMDGYLSRLHYFTWWMNDHVSRGLLSEVKDDKHFTAPITVRNHYMSTHPQSYKFLVSHPERVDSIAAMEQRENGPAGYYLPERFTALGRKELSAIHDGDVVAIVTTKDGLDYSHLGFAAWGKDGRLHLLNASMVYKKVVEDPVTLHAYLKKRVTSTGIRLLRLNGQ